jgi:hypothetical protein
LQSLKFSSWRWGKPEIRTGLLPSAIPCIQAARWRGGVGLSYSPAWSWLRSVGPVERPSWAVVLQWGKDVQWYRRRGRHVMRRAQLHPQLCLRLHSSGDAGLWFWTWLRRLASAVASFSERWWPKSGEGGGRVHAGGTGSAAARFSSRGGGWHPGLGRRIDVCAGLFEA